MFVESYPIVAGGITSSASNNASNQIKRPRAASTAGGMDQRGESSMATLSVALRCAETVTVILDSIEVTDLVEQLDFLKWTGRPGYSTRTMMGVMLAKSVYTLPTWTRTLELVREHRALRTAIGCEDEQDVPSIDAIYRFTKKLRLCEGQLQACTDAVLEALHSKKSGMGKDIAIDGSSMEAYAKGAKTRYPGGPEREFSDPDASWGHRSAISTRDSGQFYGYKIHMAVDTATELPLAWEVHTAKDAEAQFALSLLDEVKERGFSVHTAAMDKGYDIGPIYNGCEERNVRPIIPLRETEGVKKGWDKPPTCEHGEWKFAGADYKRGATKWRCPTGECEPASTWIKADRLHPLIPRGTNRWKGFYCGRTAVEREFGRLKDEMGTYSIEGAQGRASEAAPRSDDSHQAGLCVGEGPWLSAIEINLSA
jgi:transposase, IS5 family